MLVLRSFCGKLGLMFKKNTPSTIIETSLVDWVVCASKFMYVNKSIYIDIFCSLASRCACIYVRSAFIY